MLCRNSMLIQCPELTSCLISLVWLPFTWEKRFNTGLLADPLIIIIQRKNNLYYAVRITPIYYSSIRVVWGSLHFSASLGQNPPAKFHVCVCIRYICTLRVAGCGYGSVHLGMWKYGFWAGVSPN